MSTSDHATPSRKALDALILRNHTENHIEYKGFLSNHHLHALVALWKLGGSEQQLNAWYDAYEKYTEPKKPTKNVITDDNWKSLMGQSKYAHPAQFSSLEEWEKDWKDTNDFAAYVDYFTAKLEERSVSEVVAEYYPTLVYGICGAALHPIIHLGFALESGNKAAIAEGLAYHCFGRLDLEDYEFDKEHKADPVQILADIHEDPAVPEKDVFQAYLNKLATDKRVSALGTKYASRWDFSELPTDQVIETLTTLTYTFFASTKSRDFFAIHGITALYSLTLILPHLKEDIQRRALRMFWLTLLHVYMAQGRPEISPVREADTSSLRDWKEMEQIVLKPVEDEHRIKMVFASEIYFKRYAHNPTLQKLIHTAVSDLFESDSYDY